LIFFDYIFYRAYILFLKLPKRRSAKVQALCSVATVQYLNFFFFLHCYKYVAKKELFHLDDIMIIVVVSSFLLLNFLRYWGFIDLSSLSQKWQDEDRNKKRIHGIAVISYIVLSLILAMVHFH
jgi:hypothetical protein